MQGGFYNLLIFYLAHYQNYMLLWEELVRIFHIMFQVREEGGEVC